MRIVQLQPSNSRTDRLECRIRYVDRGNLAKVWEAVYSEEDSCNDSGERASSDSAEETSNDSGEKASDDRGEWASDDSAEETSGNDGENPSDDSGEEVHDDSEEWASDYSGEEASDDSAEDASHDGRENTAVGGGNNTAVDSGEAVYVEAPEVDKIRAYEAVSYAWGIGEFTKNLIVLSDAKSDQEHTIVKITAHVEEMLRFFRSKQDIVNLWVDAICLNQSDTLEIAQQIALMGEVYGKAWRTRIWLGPEDDDVEKIFEFLKTTYSHKHVKRHAEEVFGGNIYDPGHALESFFSRSWFTRRWVVQEKALSWNAFIFAGKHSVGFRAAGDGLYSLWVFAGYDERLSSTRHAVQLLDSERIVVEFSTNPRWWEEVLLNQLYGHHKLECRLPKDRLLAYHGISDMDPMWLAQVERYGSASWMYEGDMTWQQFYMTVAQFYIESSPGTRRSLFLHIAAFGSLADVDICRPSWCPNWSRCRKNENESDVWSLRWYSESCYEQEDALTVKRVLFDEDSTRLLVTEYALKIQGCVEGINEQDLLGIDLEAMLGIFSPTGLPMAGQLTIKALCLLLTRLEVPDLQTTTISSLTSLFSLWRDAVPKYSCQEMLEAWHDVIPEESVDAFYTFLPTILAKYTIFSVEPTTIETAPEKAETLYGIGLCNRQTCRYSVKPGDLILTGPPVRNEKNYMLVQTCSPFVRNLTSDECLALSGEISTKQIQAMADCGWSWDTDTASVGRIGGGVGMVFFKGPSLLSPPAKVLQRHDIVIV